MKWMLLAIASVCAVVAGCEDGRRGEIQPVKAKSAAASENDGRYTVLESDAVLVRVGTNAVTRADLDKLVSLRVKILKMTLPPQQQGNAINVSAVRMPLLARLPEVFRMQTALATWAATNGIAPTTKEIETFRKRFLAGCKRPSANFNTFIKKNFNSEEIKTINERVKSEATTDKAQRTWLALNQDAVEKPDVDAIVKRVKDYNKIAIATNALIWAKATNIWNRIKAGENFAVLADEFSEDEGQVAGGDWGTFRYGDLANDNGLDKTVAAMHVGEVSAPIEADNGLNILLLKDVVNGDGESIGNGARDGDVRYELSRIFFHLPEIYEIPSRDEAARLVRERAESIAITSFVNRLIKDDGVEYPSGTAIFENAKSALKMPSMMMQEGVTEQTLKEQAEKIKRAEKSK